jgi:transcription-repair coupling factor (superfamily II helicase)
LGSGFRLAFQDLEIRGAGNILGPSQSGHIAAVGYEMYTHLLERKVRELRGEKVVEEITPEMKLPFPTFIPNDYVTDPHQRLVFYKRLSSARSEGEIDNMKEELVDRFGPVPPSAENLLEAMKLRLLLTRLRVRKLNLSAERTVVAFDDSAEISPQSIVDLVQGKSDQLQFTPSLELILSMGKEGEEEAFWQTKSTLEELIECIQARSIQPNHTTAESL